MESECEIRYPQQFASTVEEPQTVLGGSGIWENCKKLPLMTAEIQGKSQAMGLNKNNSNAF